MPPAGYWGNKNLESDFWGTLLIDPDLFGQTVTKNRPFGADIRKFKNFYQWRRITEHIGNFCKILAQQFAGMHMINIAGQLTLEFNTTIGIG